MKYDFSKYFDEDNTILNKFIENYTTYITNEDDMARLISIYKTILEHFLEPFEAQTLIDLSTKLADCEIGLDKPYAIVSNEIYSLQNLLIQHMVLVRSDLDILGFLDLFNKIDNNIASIYLKMYIEKLLSVNNLRINSLSDLIDRNIIKYYEAHLSWLSDLAKYVSDPNIHVKPELNEQKCGFGQWLQTDGKRVIKNNSKYKSITHLHKNLHMYGDKIQDYLQTHEQHIVITYLEKCELLSLSIGTELALLDNIIMNNNVIKDQLTGALNRHALENVFASQYELSLATKNSFVLAMCDLDFFKSINDTYGHIAGDKVLKSFVALAKKYLRNSDMIIRYGGEEFIILLPAISKDMAFEVLEKIRKEFSLSYIELDGQEVKTTVSMGIVEIEPECQYRKDFLESYLNVADKNLYRAKETGRNRVIKDSF